MLPAPAPLIVLEPAVPVVDPLVLPAPDAVEPVAVEPLPEVPAPEADVPLEVPLPVPAVLLPDPGVPYPDALPAPAPDIEACVSVKLSLEPCRQPVRVTVRDDELALLLCDPLVPVVLPLVGSCVPLVVPLWAATVTANAQASAMPEAVVTTRLMCSSSC